MATTKGYMMRNDALQMLLRCSFLLIPTMLLFAGETAAQQPSQPVADTAIKQEKAPQSRQSLNPNRSPRTVKPYLPSEKVSADKTVSFPVDI